ncbi:MAG: hypothetical protein GX442_14595 [Candidatus Riflebacteria bacterium]|nr:hypothetical protein [Candidatus Riflebacteria bacterium]
MEPRDDATPAKGKKPIEPRKWKNGPTPPPVVRLTSFDGIRQHLQWAIRETENGWLDPKVLNSLAAAMNVLAGILERHDLEERVKKLEEVTR